MRFHTFRNLILNNISIIRKILRTVCLWLTTGINCASGTVGSCSPLSRGQTSHEFHIIHNFRLISPRLSFLRTQESASEKLRLWRWTIYQKNRQIFCCARELSGFERPWITDSPSEDDHKP
jgi:hypothetical protein